MAASVAIPLLAAEGFLRLTGDGVTLADSKHKFEIRLDPRILYRVIPHSSADMNRYGFRDREFPKKRAADGPVRILFLGDSFVMGLNVPSKRTWPKALEKTLGSGFEVMNLGVVGYGPDQSLTQLEDQALDFDPDVVVLSIFAANDFNDLAKNELFSVDPTGKLVRNSSNPVIDAVSRVLLVQRLQTLLWDGPLDEKQQQEMHKTLFRDTYDLLNKPSTPASLKKIELMRAVLLEFASILKKREVPFLVAIAPVECSVHQTPWCIRRNGGLPGQFVNEDIVADLCEEAEIHSVHLGPDFLDLAASGKNLYSGDQHFSARGNRQAARLVKEALQSHFPDRFPSHPDASPESG